MCLAIIGLVILGAALAGGIIVGIIRTVTDEVWPDW